MSARHPRALLAWLVVPALLVLQLVPIVAKVLPKAAAASALSLRVESARTVPGTVKQGDQVTSYRWLITADDNGEPDNSTAALRATCTPTDGNFTPGLVSGTYQPGDGGASGYPATGSSCQWPSVRYTPGALAIVDEGQVGVTGLTDKPFPTGGLPQGKYLVSVTADGYKIDGEHFRIDGNGQLTDTKGNAITSGQVLVTMQPYPLPLGTLSLQVFEDIAPVDGTYEAGVEPGLENFVTHINDVLGEVTTDFYGNRLCTNYMHAEKLADGSQPGVPRDPRYYDANRPESATNYVHAGYSASNYDVTSPVVFSPDGGATTNTIGDGTPMIDTAHPGGTCLSDHEGVVAIRNLGPDRYTATVIPPSGQSWYQTTTLEGNHDWDMWIAEGDTGMDQEIKVGGEQVPPVDMGYVPANTAGGKADSAPQSFTPVATPLNPNPTPLDTSSGNVGEVKGQVVEVNTYVGGKGGVATPTELTLAGMSERGPVPNPIVTLSSLDDNDQVVWVGRGDGNGNFDIPGVPSGNYQATFWDYNQDLIINSVNVTVEAGKTADMGHQGLVDWYTDIKGRICIDSNGNGKCDTGEKGVPQFPVTFRERDNSLFDAGQNATTSKTDGTGAYEIREAYPVTRWSILEAFDTRYYTTGVTVKADNEPTPTTYLGASVDINVLPVIGLSGTVDWAVKPYENGANGGIVGTVTYDTTRNELDPKYAFTEDYQPGVPGITVHLYYPDRDPNTGDLQYNADGSVKVISDGNGKPIDFSDPYVTETWKAPRGCAARQYDGKVLATGTGAASPGDQNALPPANDPQYMCVEAPMMGWQAKPSDYDTQADGYTPALDANGNYTNFGQTVNGNYGFGTTNHNLVDPLDPAAPQVNGAVLPLYAPLHCLAAPGKNDPARMADCPSGSDYNIDDQALPNDDFVVKVDDPTVDGKGVCDPSQTDNNCLYQVTKEEDVNVFDGDARMPQENYPLTGSPAGGAGGYTSATGNAPVSQQPGIWNDCAGAKHTVTVTDESFTTNGGSPFEGQSRPLCDAKLVSTRGNQAVAPNFNLFTPVPLPTHFWGLTVNDLGLSHDPTQAGYGEAEPLPNVPMGIYDWSGRLVDTVQTDYNGMYEATEPSTSSYNCPLPAGPCPGMYYFKGNDPGLPGAPNPQYNPRFRTIGTNFQAWPGLFTPTDTAPQQAATIALAPGSSQIQPVQCALNPPGTTAAQTVPDVYTISKPYVMQPTARPQVLTATSGAQRAISRIAVGNNGVATVTLNGTIGHAYPVGTLVTLAGIPPLANTGTVDFSTLNGVQKLVGATAAFGNTFRINAQGLTGSQNYTTAGPAPTGRGTTTFPDYYATSNAAALPAGSPVTSPSLTIQGSGFGTGTKATVLVTRVGSTNPANVIPTNNANDSTLNITLPASVTTNPGVYQISVRNNVSGKTSVSGYTFYVLGGGYNPPLLQVNPAANVAAASSTLSKGGTSTLLNSVDDPANGVYADTTYDNGVITHAENVIQHALDQAQALTQGGASPTPLVVVWPKTSQIASNPLGEYFENLVVGASVKLQGVGTGGFQGTKYLRGARINGLGFNADNANGTAWINTVTAYGYDPTTVSDSATVTVLGDASFDTVSTTDQQAAAQQRASLDGLAITGGDQGGGAPTNVNTVTGASITPVGGVGALTTQGGGVYLFGHANNLQVSNSAIFGNSGSYAGGIRVGTPYTANADGTPNAGSTPADWANTGVRITNNRISDNGGSNLAGGIGLFDGSDNYVVDHNDLCGNFSAEYGGGISHYGRSNSGQITFNRIYLNQSYDEGGGVMVAGELNSNLSNPSQGAEAANAGLTGGPAPMVLDGNLVEQNVANDDGGGIRFLQAGDGAINVTNDMVVNNISTHEGGGFALDDSTNVRIIGSTVMKNLTTATAVTSDGLPAPAGLSTAGNSDQLQGTLAANAPTFSRPTLIDDIFLDNRAGTFDPTSPATVTGIGQASDTGKHVIWDVGSTDTTKVGAAALPLTNTLTSAADGTSTLFQSPVGNQVAPNAASRTLVPGSIPGLVVKPYDVTVAVLNSRTFPGFRQAQIVTNLVNSSVLSISDYHLRSVSNATTNSAVNRGTSTGFAGLGVTTLMSHDIDYNPFTTPVTGTRPLGGAYDVGADEVR